jgi:Flp pilus assembly protein TadD
MRQSPKKSKRKPGMGLKPEVAGPRFPAWLPALLLMLMTILAYQPVWHAGFIWDDDVYVTGNPMLHSIRGLAQIWCDPTATAQYYPLVHTSFWMEYHLWGLNPLGYHVVNVLLHILAAILLWRVLVRLQAPGAWLAAGIFALHPVAAESVAWVTERKNVLSTVFYFAAALAYWRWNNPLAEGGTTGRNIWRWYFFAFVMFLFALLSKTVTCSLPAALLLVIWWKRGRVAMRDIRPLLPFFGMGAGLGLVTAWLERTQVGAQGPEWAFSFSDRWLIAGRALWFYAGKLCWPTDLMFIYPRWQINAGEWWQWIFPAAALMVVVALWCLRGRIGRGPLVAVLFFGGTLFPALGFTNVYPMRYSFVADHFQYLASAGLMALAAAALVKILRPISFMAILLPTGLAVLTWKQSHIYSDQTTLWQDTLAKNPTCWMAHVNLGSTLIHQGQTDRAIGQCQQAINLKPDDAEAHNNLGIALFTEGRTDEAISEYQESLRLKPENAEAHNNFGNALLNQGRINEAIVQYQEAIHVKPNSVEAHYDLGTALLNQGRTDEAIVQFQETLRLEPDDAEAHNNLGLTFLDKGQTDEAVNEFLSAIHWKPEDAEAYYNLGIARAKQAQMDAAIDQFEKAIQLKPDYASAHYNLGAIFFKQGRINEAINEFQQTLRLNPEDVNAQRILTQALELKSKAN